MNSTIHMVQKCIPSHSQDWFVYVWRLCLPANALRNITDPYTISLSIYLLAVTRTVFTSWLFVNTALNVGMEDTVSGDAGWLNVPQRDYEIHTSYAFNFFGSTHADFCTSCSSLLPPSTIYKDFLLPVFSLILIFFSL